MVHALFIGAVEKDDNPPEPAAKLGRCTSREVPPPLADGTSPSVASLLESTW